MRIPSAMSARKVRKIGTIQTKYRNERFVDKSVRICDPIHRVNIKTFNSKNKKEKSRGSGKKAKGKKEFALGQKQLGLACVRGYDKQLFK